MLDKESLGTYVIKNGEIFEVVAYAQDPTLELKSILNGRKESVVVGSEASKEYKPLYTKVYDEASLCDREVPVVLLKKKEDKTYGKRNY